MTIKIQRVGGSRHAIQRLRVDASGRATVRFRPRRPGTYRLRLAVGAAGASPGIRASRRLRVAAAPAGRPYVYAAGDIGACGGQPAATARLIPAGATFVAAGDLAYPSGRATDFASCYLPYYGRLRTSTFPVPGNHEYYGGDGAYFRVFGSRVGTPSQPWYAATLGGWQFLMLNSNCSAVGGCGSLSPQYHWLAGRLAASNGRCLAAVWHAPRWSSGPHGSNASIAPLYRLLQRAGADIVLSGHDHDYERFARMTDTGALSGSGMRQFVVGTGGAGLYAMGSRVAGSQVRNNRHHGVLRLELGATGYSWRFLSTDGVPVDSGSDTC